MPRAPVVSDAGALTATTSPVRASATSSEGQSFSIIPGGPLYQAFRRTHLVDDAMGLAPRRIGAAVLLVWAPLVVLSALEGRLIAPGDRGFLNDVGFQLRFLLVVPLLVLAEVVVHRQMRPIIAQFRIRGLVPPGEIARFEDAVGEAMRWRNSGLAEGLLLGAVYALGLFFTWRRYLAIAAGGWYGARAGGSGLSLAGLWLVFVSLPLLQFLFLRWYYRLFIWARLLWRLSRLDLDLEVTHPDRAGGLGFLSESLAAFAPIAFAHGVLFTGMISDRILYAGASLADFSVEVLGGAVVLVLAFAGPLAVFGPRLAAVKWAGLREYGALGQDYVRDFRRKWMSGGPAPDEPLVGSGDIQSLADLGNSFSAAERMRFAPIRPSLLIFFVAAFLAPIAPLLLTLMPAEQILSKLVGLVF